MLKTGIHTSGTQTIDGQIYVAKITGPKRTEAVRSLVLASLYCTFLQ